MEEEVTSEKLNDHAKLQFFERNLRVKLTDKEIADRANRAAHVVAEIDQLEQEREAANKHAKARIAEIEAELKKVSTEVRDRATYRPVRCERAYIYRTGNVTERRLDTGEMLAERPMSEYERQTELPLEREETSDTEPPPSSEPDLETAKKKRNGRKPKGKAS